MTALEMMDPKMDAGMRCNKNKTAPLTFDSAVISGRMKLDGLSYAEFIGIADSLMSCFVTWLEGHSLAQTVYTCLYLHNINAILDQPLKSFCLGMNNLMRVVKDIIHAAAVYEEEDFQPIIFPHPPEEVPHEAVYASLKLAEDNLGKLARNAADEHQAEVLQATISRLKCLRFFVDTLNVFYEAKGDIDFTTLRSLNLLSDLLAAVKSTQHLGTQKEPDCECLEWFRNCLQS